MGYLEDKRLLLLGGGQWKEAIHQFAIDEGIVLLAAGNDPDSGIFSIAQKGFVVDSTNAKDVLGIIRSERVDGVYLGGAEPVIEAALEYLPKAGIPTYCTQSQWMALQNKREFKRLCMSHELPTVNEYAVHGEGADVSSSDYPVIVKPADGSGSNGTTVCRSNSDLLEAIRHAKAHSFSNSCIVERFVNNKDACVVFYSFANGACVFHGIEDKYVVEFEDHGSFIAGLLIFESDTCEAFRSRFEKRLRSMFQSLGLTEGCLWMEVFRDGDRYYFNEAGYRHGGSMSMYPISYFYDVNQVASEMHFSLTGRGDLAVGKPLFPDGHARARKYAVYPVPMLSGTIDRVEGLDELKHTDGIMYVCVRKAKGQIVRDTGSFDQVFALVHFVFDSMEQCRATIERVHNILHVCDEFGEELLVRMISFEERPFSNE